MRFKKIALVLFACLALGAVAANAAQAAPEWTLGTVENQEGAGTRINKESVKCSKHGTSELNLSSTVLGAPIKLKANGIDCVEATIDTVVNAANEGIEAHSAGKLTFTEVSVEPATCMVPNNELTTTALTDRVKMDPTAGSTVVYDEFFPEAGSPFLEIELTGAECPFAGIKAPVNGTACGEAVHTNAAGTGYEPNKTGTLTKVQTLLFGAAQQTTGVCALTLGKAAATFSGAVDNSLSGAKAGEPFGAD